MKGIAGKYLYGFGAVASIIALLVALLEGGAAGAIVALIVVVLFLSVLLWRILSTFKQMTRQRYPEGYLRVSTFAYLGTEDGIHYTYEVYKHIQSKQLLMSEDRYGFNWSGSKYPVINSDLQEVGELVKTGEESFDRVALRFRNPVLYNQVEVVHIRMSLDDSKGDASPHLEIKVFDPIKVIHFNVALRHKDQNPPAEFYRRKIQGEVSQGYKLITNIPFDTVSRSYQHYILMPEVGYYYRIQWEK